jgi:hypothetical protein
MTVHSTTERPSALPQDRPPATRLGVPWKTVVALAVVLAYADGFWLTSLQGAVGAIERTQGPFASWLRESTMVLPVFVFAVVGVLTLALRWFGPVLTRPKTLAVTGLLIVAAGTIVGLGAIVASSAYDYHLQSAQLHVMDSMHAICTGNCFGAEQHATLLVHIRGVLLISRWLLVTNLVLVAWLVAVWGGRLKITTGTRQPAGHTNDSTDTLTGTAPDTQQVAGRSRAQDIRLLLVGSLAASAAIHAAQVPSHLTQWSGAFFLFLTVWELAVAYLLFARLDGHLVLPAAAAISIAPLAVLVSTHPSGLPGYLAGALEVATLLSALALLRNKPWLTRPGSANHRGLILIGLLAITAIAVAGAGLSWFDPFGISAHQPTLNLMNMSR